MFSPRPRSLAQPIALSAGLIALDTAALAQTPSVQFLQQGRAISASAGPLGGPIISDSDQFAALGPWSESATANSPGVGFSSISQNSTLEVIPATPTLGRGILISASILASVSRSDTRADGGASGIFNAFFAVTGAPAEYVIDAPISVTGSPMFAGPFASMYGPAGEIEVFDFFGTPPSGGWPAGQIRGTLVPGGYNLSAGLLAFASANSSATAQLTWTMRVTPLPPTCPADINRSGDVSVQDIFDFFSFYFANNPRADINADTTVTVQDIFDFLRLYFTAC